MTADAGRVEVDTSKLERYTRNLQNHLERDGKAGARAAAEQTAATISQNVPHRTGRLAASVQVVPDSDGYGVSYGSAVPYASYIERRTSTVADAVSGAQDQFSAAMVTVAEKAARSA